MRKVVAWQIAQSNRLGFLSAFSLLRGTGALSTSRQVENWLIQLSVPFYAAPSLGADCFAFARPFIILSEFTPNLLFDACAETVLCASAFGVRLRIGSDYA